MALHMSWWLRTTWTWASRVQSTLAAASLVEAEKSVKATWPPFLFLLPRMREGWMGGWTGCWLASMIEGGGLGSRGFSAVCRPVTVCC